MRQLLRNRSRAFNAAAGWLALGALVWAFLLAPYIIASYDCALGDFDEHDRAVGKVECLKPVAQDLREDANIATYATATVAAIIALQLANRGRTEAESPHGNDDPV